MKSSETAPTKLLLGTAAASLAALGIAFVASSVEVPQSHTTTEHHEYDCRMPVASPPPPAPAPIEVDLRPLAPASK